MNGNEVDKFVFEIINTAVDSNLDRKISIDKLFTNVMSITITIDMPIGHFFKVCEQVKNRDLKE